MGFKPHSMTPYPAEWLLDFFDHRQHSSPRPYMFAIETPPMPWMLQELIPGLQNGWSCILVTVVVGALSLYLR